LSEQGNYNVLVEVKKTTIWLRKKDAEKPIDGRIKNQGVIMIENKIILIEDDKEIRGMRIEGALRMSDEINAQFGFERAFGKTKGIENSADTDTKITKFGISFNSDGTTTFFAQLEKTSASQKEYLEKIQEKKAAEKKEAKKKEQLKQIEVKKATVQANSKDELLDKIKNIEWNSIKPEDNKIGGRFDFSI